MPNLAEHSDREYYSIEISVRLQQASELYSNAESDIEKGLFDRAANTAQEILDLTSDDISMAHPNIDNEKLIEYHKLRTLAYRVLSQSYAFNGDSSRALVSAEDGVRVAENSGSQPLMLRAYVAMGNILRRTNKTDQAEGWLQKAVEIGESLHDEEGLVGAYGGLATLHSALADDQVSRYYATMALERAEKLGIKSAIASQLSVLSVLNLSSGDYQIGFGQLNRALEIWYELGNTWAAGILLGNIGGLHIYQGNYIEGIELLRKSLNFAYEIGNRQIVAITKASLATVYSELGDYEQAQSLYSEAVHTYLEIGNNRAVVGPLVGLAECLHHRGDIDGAVQHCHQAMSVAKETGIPVLELPPLLLGVSFDLELGYLSDAVSKIERCEELIRLYPNQSFEAEVLYLKGELLSDPRYPNADTVRATELLRSAFEKSKDLNSVKFETRLCFKLAEVLARQGEHAEAYALSLEGVKRERHLNSLKLRQALERANLDSERLARAKLQSKNEELTRLNALNQLKQQKLEEQDRIIRDSNVRLVETNKALEDAVEEVSLLNRELHQRNEYLHQLNEEKNDFLNIAAHDLKNPLAGIALTAEMIRHNADKAGNHSDSKLASTVMKSADRMRELIEKLLDVSAIESGEVTTNRTQCHLQPIVHELVEAYRLTAAEKNITIHCLARNIDDLVYADAFFIHQAIDNLLSNAVKYSPKGKNVFVALTSLKINESGTVRIEVRDEGPGISSQDQGKLFRKFTRLSARPTGGESSTGLGLAFVKQAMKLMGGRVWCESELGQGTSFYLELPLTAHDGRLSHTS